MSTADLIANDESRRGSREQSVKNKCDHTSSIETSCLVFCLVR